MHIQSGLHGTYFCVMEQCKMGAKTLEVALKKLCSTFSKKDFFIVSSKYTKVYISETQTAKVDVLRKVIYPKYSKH